jgi:hypothetical protein
MLGKCSTPCCSLSRNAHTMLLDPVTSSLTSNLRWFSSSSCKEKYFYDVSTLLFDGYEEYGLLGCEAVYSGRTLLAFLQHVSKATSTVHGTTSQKTVLFRSLILAVCTINFTFQQISNLTTILFYRTPSLLIPVLLWKYAFLKVKVKLWYLSHIFNRLLYQFSSELPFQKLILRTFHFGRQ